VTRGGESWRKPAGSMTSLDAHPWWQQCYCLVKQMASNIQQVAGFKRINRKQHAMRRAENMPFHSSYVSNVWVCISMLIGFMLKLGRLFISYKA
jgi:hypothetical protein